MMTPAIIFASIVALLLGWRFLVARRWERVVSDRLRPGPDGIVPGAGAIDARPLPGITPRGAVLLLHGFGDSPQTMAHIATALQARGFRAYAPLLPGHGRTLREFAASGADAWIDAARSEYEAMRREHGPVGLVGLSMGGALAVLLAAGQSDVPSVVLLAPYLDAPRPLRAAASAHRFIGAVAPYVGGRGAASIRDARASAESLSYRASSPRLLFELIRLADRARAELSKITAPTLIVQSRNDNRIATAVAEHALAQLGSRERRLTWLEESGHVITVDFGYEKVAEMVCDWVEGHAGAERGETTSGQVA
ncbi:MAG: alpha/beta fold hydrolase [Gemmatimonadota bacterium]|nr:alpha/beta fold hydrolase [Gemmatimonadota bacterium]